MAGRPKLDKFPKELNDQMIRFCHEYVKDQNGTQAYIRAGYSPKNAKQGACRLMKHEGVRDLIDSLNKVINDRLLITSARIRNELAKIGFANMADFVQVKKNDVTLNDFDDMSREDTAAIAEVTQKTGKVEEIGLKLHNKVAALEIMAKIEKMFVERLEISTPPKIVDDIE